MSWLPSRPNWPPARRWHRWQPRNDALPTSRAARGLHPPADSAGGRHAPPIVPGSARAPGCAIRGHRRRLHRRLARRGLEAHTDTAHGRNAPPDERPMLLPGAAHLIEASVCTRRRGPVRACTGDRRPSRLPRPATRDNGKPSCTRLRYARRRRQYCAAR